MARSRSIDLEVDRIDSCHASVGVPLDGGCDSLAVPRQRTADVTLRMCPQNDAAPWRVSSQKRPTQFERRIEIPSFKQAQVDFAEFTVLFTDKPSVVHNRRHHLELREADMPALVRRHAGP